MPRHLGGFSALLLAATLAGCGQTADSAERPPAAEQPAAAPTAPDPETPAAAEPEAAAPAATNPSVPASRAAGPRAGSRPSPEAPTDPPVSEPAIVPAPMRVVASGTVLPLTLDRALSTKANKAGDAFTARLTVDVLGADGEVLLPQGTRVDGVVTEAAESPSADVPAMMRLSVTAVRVDGEAVPMTAEVEDVQLQSDSRDSNRETAGKVAVGAAAGALLGKVVGGGAKRGAAVGAAAGAVVAITTRDGHATLPEGARLTVRVLDPLRLPAGGG